MDRGTYNFLIWCNMATGMIRYKPDRKKVYRELMTHLEDRRESFMEQGMQLQEASDKALEAMGSAEELAPQLAAVHRPFWGYVLQGCKITLVILMIISLIPIWNYFTKICKFDDPTRHMSFAIFRHVSYGGDTGRTLHHLSNPNVSFTSDGYRFTVTDTALFSTHSESLGVEHTRLYLLIDQRSLRPWTETEAYYNLLSYSSVCRQFTARDSLGNVYYSYSSKYRDDPGLNVINYQTGLFTGTHMCWINDFPAEAEWVELCYERDGRSFYLHIDLTGGGDK